MRKGEVMELLPPFDSVFSSHFQHDVITLLSGTWDERAYSAGGERAIIMRSLKGVSCCRCLLFPMLPFLFLHSPLRFPLLLSFFFFPFSCHLFCSALISSSLFIPRLLYSPLCSPHQPPLTVNACVTLNITHILEMSSPGREREKEDRQSERRRSREGEK